MFRIRGVGGSSPTLDSPLYVPHEMSSMDGGVQNFV
jgi:hypothetical protein